MTISCQLGKSRGSRDCKWLQDTNETYWTLKNLSWLSNICYTGPDKINRTHTESTWQRRCRESSRSNGVRGPSHWRYGNLLYHSRTGARKASVERTSFLFTCEWRSRIFNNIISHCFPSFDNLDRLQVVISNKNPYSYLKEVSRAKDKRLNSSLLPSRYQTS